MDDPKLFGHNVKERADQFTEKLRQRALLLNTNNVMVPFGGDFKFSNAKINFKNMDKLMKYINQHFVRI